MAWASVAEARAILTDWGSVSDEVLAQLLADASEQCAEYAPPLRVPASGSLELPGRWKRAVVYQARELHLARERQGDLIGVGDLAIAVRPLGTTVRALLRPERGRPGVG